MVSLTAVTSGPAKYHGQGLSNFNLQYLFACFVGSPWCQRLCEEIEKTDPLYQLSGRLRHRDICRRTYSNETGDQLIN